MSLNNLTTFPSITSLEFDPSTDGTRFDTDHLLPPVLWREIGHPFGFLVPKIPYCHIWKGVSCDYEGWLSVLVERDWDGGSV
jgi:hypothetical protein